MSTYVFLHDNLLKLAVGGRDQLVVGKSLATQEDVEHQRDALEAKQIISAIRLSPMVPSMYVWLVFSIPVGGDFDLELRGLLHAVDDRAVLVCGLWSLSQRSSISKNTEMSVHLHQAQCLFNRVSLSCPAEYLVGTRPTEFEAQLVKFLRSIAVIAQTNRQTCVLFSISATVYVLPTQLLEEGGLVDRDSGHGGGIRDAIKSGQAAKRSD